MVRHRIAVSVLFALLALSARAEDLPAQAKGILAKHCFACHGQDNSSEGGFGYVLNVQEMINQRKLVPKSAKDSKLIKQIVKEDMPPRDEGPNGSKTPLPPVSAADLAILKEWIDTGAADFNPPQARREFITEAAIFDAIKSDLERLPPGDAIAARYFSLVHLYNAGASAEELQGYAMGLGKLLNSLSWSRKLVTPQPIDAAKTIFRINLNNYRWARETWQSVVNAYPYGIKYTTPSAVYCYQATGNCFVPYVRADWFVHAASEPKLYHAVLGIPSTVKELERILGVNAEENIQYGRVARAGFNGSGVSENNRVIERHVTDFGSYWKSYDFAGNDGAKNDGEKNIFARPLGPGTDKYSFVADGGEMIFSLPNGLQGYMLTDEKGGRIDKGPTSVVHDDKAIDRAVANGRSCMSCHSQGMIEKTDEIRKRVQDDRAFGIKELKRVEAMYIDAAEMTKLYSEDRERFVTALAAIGVDPKKPEPVRALSKRFESELGLELAAAEVGLQPKQFLEYLERSHDVSRQLGNLRSGTVKRDLFMRTYGMIVSEFDLGEYLTPGGVRGGGAHAGGAVLQEIALDLGGGEKLELVYVAPGEFRMGSEFADAEAMADERPARSVKMAKGYYIGKFPVTVGQFDRFVRATGYKTDAEKAGFGFGVSNWVFAAVPGVQWRRPLFAQNTNHPAVVMSWNDSAAFAAWAAQTTGKNVRLPTEAQWEYAARGPKGFRFPWGNVFDGSRANHADLALRAARVLPANHPYSNVQDGFAFTSPVGSYNDASWCGVRDMGGNVLNWCQDPYDENLYAGRTDGESDPAGPARSSKQPEERVIRGGNWIIWGGLCRTALRSHAVPEGCGSFNGFRVALLLE